MPMLLSLFFTCLNLSAQPVGKWQYDFSSRIQMRVNDQEFFFERCELDSCHPISKKLRRAKEEHFRDIMLLVKHPESQLIFDALINYQASPPRYAISITGASIAPEKFQIHCSQKVAEFVDAAVKKKARSKTDYIFKYEGPSNKYCQSGRPGSVVKTMDEYQTNVKELESLYLAALKEVESID